MYIKGFRVKFASYRNFGLKWFRGSVACGSSGEENLHVQGHMDYLCVELVTFQGHMDYLEGNYARSRAVGGSRPKIATVEGAMVVE